MNSRCMKVLVMGVVAAGLVLGQQSTPGRGRRGMMGGNFDPAQMVQMRVDRLAQRLSLTDAQKTQATKIFTDAQTASQPIITSIQDNHTSLRDAVKKNDLGAIDQLSSTIGGLNGQLTSIQAKADAAFYAILTPDQQSKYGTGGMAGRFGGGMMGRPGWGRQ